MHWKILEFFRYFFSTSLDHTVFSTDETSIHIFRHCIHARKIWEQILTPPSLTKFLVISDTEWLKANLTRLNFDTVRFHDIPWPVIFLATTWNVWKARNCKVFNRTTQHANQTLYLIRQDALDLHTSFNGGLLHAGSMRWSPPALNWVKLNTDGSTRPYSNQGAIGGVLRDERGSWIWGFFQKIQTPSVDESEPRALVHGLTLAWENRVERLEVEIDSENVWKAMDGGVETLSQFPELVGKCHELLGKPWEINLKNIYRAANGTADALAKLSYKTDDGGGGSWTDHRRRFYRFWLLT
ncbi:hypothetical protein OROMI_029244 [Orobanche minor]